MERAPSNRAGLAVPSAGAVLELLKPVTWFPPMWAFLCGAVSSGVAFGPNAGLVIAGMILAGPLSCGASQAVNDWFDREVDAINEPNRPIPSGRIPGEWGLWLAIASTALALIVAAALGPIVLAGASLGAALSWAYSAPPLRFKLDGWLGPAAVAISYEGLTWFTGAALLLGAFPNAHILLLAGLYSAGAHGVMTLNDFKAIEGDWRMGVRSLPVRYGPKTAARIACWVMAVPQVVVILLLFAWGRPIHAGVVTGFLLVQLLAMRRLVRDPARHAPWYNGVGVSLYAFGMLTAALAVASLPETPS